MLEVRNLVKHFPIDRDSYIGAVNDVTFSIGRGETLGLVGESGSGKTTIGRLILRLVEATAGEIRYDGVDIRAMDASQLRALRARMQLVFQDPFGSLNPRLSIRRTIEEPLLLHGSFDRSERLRRVEEILDRVRLDRSVLDVHPIALTASEQQRVGIARAFVTRPSLVVLDEPTSTLDPTVRAEILELLADIQRELGTSYLFISHDLEAVQSLSDRIAILYLGRLLEVADTDAIMANQHHPYARALLASVLHPDPDLPLPPTPIRGEISSAVNPPDRCPFLPRCTMVESKCHGNFPQLVSTGLNHFTACYRADELAASA